MIHYLKKGARKPSNAMMAKVLKLVAEYGREHLNCSVNYDAIENDEVVVRRYFLTIGDRYT